MDDLDDISKLEELLAAQDSDNEETQSTVENSNSKVLNTTDKFSDALYEANIANLSSFKKEKANKSHINEIKSDKLAEKSIIHDGDTDSSDDEERRNYFEKKYDDYGLQIKKIVEANSNNTVRDIPLKDEKVFSQKKNTSIVDEKNKAPLMKNNDCFADPIFGIRISNPIISGAVLIERMQGREAIQMMNIKRHVTGGDLLKDWVIAGVVVRKSTPKESQKGSQYCIWTLSDLKHDLKTISLFLFRNAYKQLWKTLQGTVVGVLNPNVLDKRSDSKDEACLSIDNPDRVMILGKSKDFGFCKSKRKNGEPCTSFVNLHQCEYCVYHVKQEYQKCSKRSDLQSTFTGRGLADLRNKVLGKNTLIYGGKEYFATPVSRSKKMNVKDEKRLSNLNNYFKNTNQNSHIINKPTVTPPLKKKAAQIDVDRAQRLKDLKRLEMLNNSYSNKKDVIECSDSNKSSVNNQSCLEVQTLNTSSTLSSVPKLGFGLKRDTTIDLCLSFTDKQKEIAKRNAIKWIKENGPIVRSNPNSLKNSNENKKRTLQHLNNSHDDDKESNKKHKSEIHSERFLKMLQATSAHSNLITQHENNEQEKYFKKLELKESMEEKMLNTFKVACKGVKCLKCQYVNFSAAERCKKEHHPLKVFDTFKRFFKCGNCGNRTTTLDLIPTHSCYNCQSSKWQRAPMISEKKCITSTVALSIRGEEEKYLGSIQSGSNINLLIPDS